LAKTENSLSNKKCGFTGLFYKKDNSVGAFLTAKAYCCDSSWICMLNYLKIEIVKFDQLENVFKPPTIHIAKLGRHRA